MRRLFLALLVFTSTVSADEFVPVYESHSLKREQPVKKDADTVYFRKDGTMIVPTAPPIAPELLRAPLTQSPVAITPQRGSVPIAGLTWEMAPSPIWVSQPGTPAWQATARIRGKLTSGVYGLYLGSNRVPIAKDGSFEMTLPVSGQPFQGTVRVLDETLQFRAQAFEFRFPEFEKIRALATAARPAAPPVAAAPAPAPAATTIPVDAHTPVARKYHRTTPQEMQCEQGFEDLIRFRQGWRKRVINETSHARCIDTLKASMKLIPPIPASCPHIKSKLIGPDFNELIMSVLNTGHPKKPKGKMHKVYYQIVRKTYFMLKYHCDKIEKRAQPAEAWEPGMQWKPGAAPSARPAPPASRPTQLPRSGGR